MLNSRAFNDLPNVRLMRCKGDHAGCSLCVLAGSLLANRSAKGKLSIIEREVVIRYRRRHLCVQARERQTLDNNRMKAATTYDAITGQPKYFLMMADGYSVHRTMVPKFKYQDKRQVCSICSSIVKCKFYCVTLGSKQDDQSFDWSRGYLRRYPSRLRILLG